MSRSTVHAQHFTKIDLRATVASTRSAHEAQTREDGIPHALRSFEYRCCPVATRPFMQLTTTISETCFDRKVPASDNILRVQSDKEVRYPPTHVREGAQPRRLRKRSK
jgi:hypothetical protein